MKLKKILAVVLALTMVLSTMSFSVFADESVTETTNVAKIGDVEYETLQQAFDAAEDGDTVELIADITTNQTINIGKTLTLDGNDHTITYTGSDRAIEMSNNETVDYDVTIENLTVNCTASYCQRGINYNDQGTLTLDGVTVKGTGVSYALNLPGSSDGVNVVINNSSLSGCIALNVWGANSVVTATDSEFISVDDEPSEDYAAIVMNNDAKGNAAIDSTLTINGGKIIAYREDGVSESTAILDNAGSEITISDTTEVAGRIESAVALVAYEGSNNFYAETTLQSAIDIAAKNSNATVVLLKDFELTETVTIDGNIVLDLNGKTITGTDAETKSFALIAIAPDADLTVNDSVGTGAITLTAETDREWNAYSTVISVQRGSLTVNGGTIEHFGGTAMAYAIDILTNTNSQNATAVINGGTIKSTYTAIRQFLNSDKAVNSLTINGGVVDGDTRGVWTQSASAKANIGALTITEDAEISGQVRVSAASGATEFPVTISVAESALNGEFVTSNIPEAYTISSSNGYYGISATRSLDVSASKAAVVAGEDVTISVTLTGEEIANAKWNLTYNPAHFELKDAADYTTITNADGTITIDDYEYLTDGTSYESGKSWTYEFTAIAQTAEVESDFVISNTYAYTYPESYKATTIAAANNEKATVTIEMQEYAVVATLDGSELEGTESSFAYDNEDHYFVVTAAPETATVTYYVNGVEVDEVVIKDEGEYVITYVVDGVPGYTPYEGEYTITVAKPEYVVEFVDNYVNGKTLVLVYTNTENVFFKYGTDVMLDVTASGYEYNNAEDDGYSKVFGFVTDGIDGGVLDDYEKNVAHFYGDKSFYTVIDVYNEDVNFDTHYDIRDITTVYGVYNVLEFAFEDVYYQRNILKSDITGDKYVKTDDANIVVGKVYPTTSN